jgi:hypothetical protein
MSLSDVDDLAIFVFEKVDAGLSGKAFNFLSQIFAHAQP